MEQVKIITRFPSGIVNPPSSKSLGHRAIICAALAKGESVISNVSLSEDISATITGVKALGSGVGIDGGRIRVRGPAQLSGAREIDCGESGSTLRFLLPIAALGDDTTIFTGRGRLMERPLNPYAGVFEGKNVVFSHTGGKIEVRGPMKNGIFKLPGDVSSQFVSGLLLALPLLEGDSEIHLTTRLESRQYVDMTIDVMTRFGVNITPLPNGYRIRGGQRCVPADYQVEADYSQAAYFLAAGALGLDIGCKGLNLNSRQADRAMLDLLERMGAHVLHDGDITYVKSNALTAIDIDAREIPDLVPPLAVLCCFCKGVSRITNAGRLRFKECDRLSVMASELTKLGAKVEEGADSLTITGVPELTGGRVNSPNDHRIAMSMALAAIKCRGVVELTGAGNVNKSYPDFWKDWEKGSKNV